MLPTGSTRYVRRGPASATASSRGRRCAWHHRGRRVGHGFPAAASPRGGAPAERERSELVAEETVYLMFQLDLDVQLQRSLNINAFDRAQEIRNRRQKLDETIAEMTERKALKMGAPGSLATLSFSDFASEGLRLRSDMQRAVEDERYEDAAKVKTLLAELEMESKRAQAEAEEWRSVQPKLRLGQRVMHRTGGYRGLVVGYDLQCCETNEWVMGVQLKGKEQQPFYHILVDERDWELEVETGMPPVAYVAEELLTCPELEDPPRAWVEEHGSEPLEHSFLNVLFLGVDGRGDYVPCRHLRNKFNVQRRDVFKPGEDPNKDD